MFLLWTEWKKKRKTTIEEGNPTSMMGLDEVMNKQVGSRIDVEYGDNDNGDGGNGDMMTMDDDGSLRHQGYSIHIHFLLPSSVI